MSEIKGLRDLEEGTEEQRRRGHEAEREGAQGLEKGDSEAWRAPREGCRRLRGMTDTELRRGAPLRNRAGQVWHSAAGKLRNGETTGTGRGRRREGGGAQWQVSETQRWAVRRRDSLVRPREREGRGQLGWGGDGGTHQGHLEARGPEGA